MDKDNYEFHHDLNDFEELDTGVCVDRLCQKKKDMIFLILHGQLICCQKNLMKTG